MALIAIFSLHKRWGIVVILFWNMLIVRKRTEISTWRMLFPDLFESIFVRVLLNPIRDFGFHESTEVLVDLVVVELLLGQLRGLLEVVGLVV